MENMSYGHSLWKFTASLLEDEEYVNKINTKSQEWIEENRKRKIKENKLYNCTW